MTITAGTTALPLFPCDRPARRPFDPPDAYGDWRTRPGLQRVRLWNDSTAWVVTRYEDIRAALSDPSVSADIHRPGMPRNPAGQRGRDRTGRGLRTDGRP